MPTLHTSQLGVNIGVDAVNFPSCGPASVDVFLIATNNFGPLGVFASASVLSGTPPPGVTPLACPVVPSMSRCWMIGIPQAVGVYTYTVRCTRTDTTFTDVDIVHTISQGACGSCPGGVCPVITITPSTLADGNVATPYSQLLTATGGVAAYVWDVIGGALPSGLTLSSGGLLSGTPSVNGAFSFVVRVLDSNGCAGIQSYNLQIGAFSGQHVTQVVVLTMTPNIVSCPTPSEGENLCLSVDDPVLFTSWDSGVDGRVWYAETELDDPLDYYGGWKEPRLLNVSEVRRSIASSENDYEVGNFSVEFADEDYAIRSAMGTYFNGREVEVFAVTPNGRAEQVVAKTIATGFVDADPSFDDRDQSMSVRLTCRDRIGQAIGWTQTGQSKLPRRVLSVKNLPGCDPAALGLAAPVWYGLLSTNITASGIFPSPIHNVDASHCGFFEGAFPAAGYGNWFNPPFPMGTVTLNVLAGGELPQETPHNEGRYYVQVFPVASNGDVGDPFPFCNPDLFADISPGNQTIEATWATVSGAARYIAVLGVFYYGVRAQQYIETTGLSATFTRAPAWMQEGSIWDLITPGARPPEDAAITYYKVRSRNGQVLSELSPSEAFQSVSVQTGFHTSINSRFRPVRIWWETTGAPEYEVLSKGPGGPITGTDYEWKWIVPSGQFDAGVGLHYFDNDFLYLDAIPLGAQEARPQGRIKPFYTRDVVLPNTDTYREFLIAGCAIQGVDDWYYDDGTGPIDNVQINQGDGTEWLFPKDGSAWYSQFTTGYRDITGIDGRVRRWAMGYGRGPKADLVASGNAIITLNIRGIEKSGAGTGALLTDLHDQALHFLQNFVVASGEGYMTGGWNVMPVMGTDGVCIINEQSFLDLKEMRQAELPGGLITAGGIGANGELIDVTEGLKRFMVSGDFRLGPNRFWQIAAYAINENLTEDDLSPKLTDEFDIHTRTMKVYPKLAELQNVLPYKYNRNHVADRWDADNQLFTNQDSIDQWRVVQTASPLEFHFVVDPTTAGFVIGKHARRRGNVPQYVVLEGSICLMHEDYDVGKYFPMKHWRGLRSGGWRDQALWILSSTFNPETRRVRLECLNRGVAPGACGFMPVPMPFFMCGE